MTIRLAITLHVFIPAIISIIFHNTQLLCKGEKKKTIIYHFIIYCLLESLNVYFVHFLLFNFIIHFIIQLLITYTLYLDKYKNRLKIVCISCFLQILSYILTEIPLDFLYVIRKQMTEEFNREFAIYALILYDTWFLGLSYYYVIEYSSKENEIRLFKYFSLLICQLIFAFTLFLLSYDLDLWIFILIMILIVVIIFITNAIMIKGYRNMNLDFLKRSELVKIQEIVEREKKIKDYKEEIENDMNTIETMIKYHLDDEAIQFVKNKVQKLKETNINSYCDHRLVDLILRHKVIEMQDKQIRTHIDIHINDHYEIDDVDLVTLLFNLIDNAIEACEDIDDKYIKIEMTDKYNCLYVEIINSKDSLVDHSLLKTTKKDKLNHGIGISIVQNIVKKYKGSVIFEDKKEYFRVKLFLKNR